MFLLRSRFRAITTRKQTRMAEHSSSQTSSTEQNQSTPFSSFLGSPRFFGGLLSRSISDEISASPTSILDSKQFCTYPKNPFGCGKCLFKPFPISNASSPDNNEHPEGVGLALIHSLNDKEREYHGDSFSKLNSKMVLFGAKLNVQVPNFCSSDLMAPKSPGDFGIKTRKSQLLRSLSMNSPCVRGKDDHQGYQEGISLREMEQSEEYTCVMTHGPNPKTTHIFDDTIVEKCLESDIKDEDSLPTNENDYVNLTSLPVDFLAFCYTCKIKLEYGKDIYMYRGEKAFCSYECRLQTIAMEEEQAENSSLDEDSCLV